MLGVSRYLLGVAEIALLAGFATLGGVKIRRRLLPGFAGPPAWLATAVLALAILIWVAELLGTVGLFKAVPYLVCVAVLALGIWALAPKPSSAVPLPGIEGQRNSGRGVAVALGLLVALVAVVHFAANARLRLSTGMTGFDSTWYHGPFAAGFFQSGNTFDLHFIAPQFLAWFYPANSELFHAIGMVTFHRDLLSPLLNLGWFVGCLFAAWCIGRPYGVAPISLSLGAVALSIPALADQAGEARNDIVGIFFLLAAVAVALNAWEARSDRRLSTGSLIVVGLAAGMAAGTKLNFLLPAAALVVGLAVIAPRGAKWRALAATGLPALAGGGYWYLRNLVHTGNPLPWVRHLGPISLPAPEQALGGREGHNVLGYLTDGSVWSDWFLPGFHRGFWVLWPLVIALALAGLLLCLSAKEPLRCSLTPNNRAKEQRKRVGVLPVAGLTGLAVVFAWLIAPTSASGPTGIPRGFESGLRYLAPALVLGLALLPVTLPLRAWTSTATPADGPKTHRIGVFQAHRRAFVALAGVLVLALIGFGYREQRGYLKHRYADPGFTTQGLDAAFKWASSISGARIATTSTRQYPLFGTDLSNHVQYIGIERPHGGFTAPSTCQTWRRLLNAGNYDYVITTRDRIGPGQPAYPPTTRWTTDPHAAPVLRKPPTAVFRLTGLLDPSSCR